MTVVSRISRSGPLLDWKLGSQRIDFTKPVAIGLMLAEQPLDRLTIRRGHGGDPGNRLSTPGDDG
jgi:hypothetical protein